MLSFALVVGGILFVAGIITCFLAPRVGPNPIFGVRIGYAYASREIWDKTNRFGGALFALVGIGTAMFGIILQFLNIAPRAGMSVLTLAMLVALLGSTVWMFVYARGLAQSTALAHEITPVKFRWLYLAPVLVTFALLVAFAIYIYPTLPVDRVASHFNLNDQPDGWQTRDEFVLTFLGFAALFVVLNVFVVFLATREPMISFGRWGTTWRLDPERGLIFTGIGLGLANLIFITVLWNIWWFMTRGVLAFPFVTILWMIVPLIVMIVGMFFILARREA